MNEIKIGDVVYLNSAQLMTMTVVSISNGCLNGVYFNSDTKEFKITPKLPIAAVTKVQQEK